jgi:hypothetical protein
LLLRKREALESETWRYAGRGRGRLDPQTSYSCCLRGAQFFRKTAMRTSKLFQLALVPVSLLLLSVPSRAEDAWGALVACCYGTTTKGTTCGDGAVSTGFGSGTTQNEAVATATRNAMSDTNQDAAWKCSTVRSFNKGCGYIAEGCNEITKQCGWPWAPVNKKRA